MVIVRLKHGRDKSVRRHHPWIFSGAVEKVIGRYEEGETVRVEDSRGEFLAWGAICTKSQIRVRVWTWDEKEEIGKEFFRQKLRIAISLRNNLVSGKLTNAFRLVHGESDGLPGLVVDQYAETLVVQFLSNGAEHWRETIADLLLEICGVNQIYERSDVDVRHLEGLPERSGALRGPEPKEREFILEGKNKFLVDVQKGQKTGFYLDQRDNRMRLQDLASGMRVLDCFSYSGGFAISALAGGADSVVAVDSSPEAIQLGKANIIINEIALSKVEWIQDDVFQLLRKFRDRDRTFDLIVLDPPKFAPTSAQVERAARGYKDINLLALKLLKPGGLLFTFSCSGGVNLDMFQKIIAGAALDAGVDAQIMEYLFQAPDHPVALNFPEGAYLKGLIIHKRI